jgi:uncharacterized protein YvpB
MRKILLSIMLIISVGISTIVFASTSTLVTNINANVYKDIKLKIPAYKQQYANSCEASTLRMALNYKNIKLASDVQLLFKFGYNPTYKDWVKNIWDDPQKQFVGFVDVAGKPLGGYGVYGLPVVKAIKSYGLDAEYSTSSAITPSFLAKSIDNKNPVIVWGYSSFTEPPYVWKTREGVDVKAFKGEHVRLVIGFKGTVDNPEGFYINDSLKGKYAEYWTTQKLMENINKVPGVTDQAVVVK